MAAYTFRAAGTWGTAGDPGDPAGKTAGDLLLMITSARLATETLNAAPAGWTLLFDTSTTTKEQLALFGRIATGDANDTVSHDFWSGTSYNATQIAAFYGDVFSGGLGSIVAHSVAAGTDGSANDIPTSALTISTADTLVIGAGFKQKTATSDGATLTDPAWMNTRIGEKDTSGNASFTVWGFTQQSTAANISASSWTQSIAESADYSSLIVSLKTAAAAPGWTAVPSMTSQTATAYTVGFTPNASCTIYGVAVIAGSAAPSIAQVKAGQNAAGAAAKANNSKAVTGADTLVLTPSDSPAFPRYDLYFVLNNAGGDSSLQSLTSEYLDPPTGKQFTTLTSLDATSPFYGTGAAVSDTVVIDTATDPNAYVVTCGVDGTVSYAAGGDTSRQLIDADVYDYSAGVYLGAGMLVYNNLVPDPGGAAFAEPLLYQKSVAITALNLLPLATDPEGDVVVATALDALPAGLSVAASDLVGTPTAYGSTDTQIQWEDAYGATYVETATIQVGDLVPDVVGDSQATAVAAIEATATMSAEIVLGTDALVPIGDVISTDPIAGTLVPPDQVVTLIISFGEGGTVYGRVVSAEGVLQTTVLADDVEVPVDAVLKNGVATNSLGYTYVCPWPATMAVGYVGGVAIRFDGALIVADESTITTKYYANGIPVSYRGEVSVSLSAPTGIKNGIGRVGDAICVSDF